VRTRRTPNGRRHRRPELDHVGEMPIKAYQTRGTKLAAQRAPTRVRSAARVQALILCLLITLTAILPGIGHADPGGRLLATGGASTVEGAAGGGLVPWATLAGYAERDEVGGALAATAVVLPDYDLRSASAAVTFHNRIELSVAKQRFDADAAVPGTTLEQDVFGVKLRLGGDLVYGRLPQLSVGVQLKHNAEFEVPALVGARSDTGVDLYVSTTRLWLAGPFGRSAFVNGTVRATRANQLGLLGFGGDRNGDYRVVGEASAGLFLNRRWAIGMEYRQKPDNLGFAPEDDWMDAFVGWFPDKRFSVVAAWSDLGSIAGLDDQRSAYLSLQFSH